MPSGTSSKTVVVGFRLPRDVFDVLQRRVDGQRTHWQSVGEYLQERIIYDVRRQHRKGKSSEIDYSADSDFFTRRLGGKDARTRQREAQRGSK